MWMFWKNKEIKIRHETIYRKIDTKISKIQLNIKHLRYIWRCDSVTLASIPAEFDQNVHRAKTFQSRFQNGFWLLGRRYGLDHPRQISPRTLVGRVSRFFEG